MEKNRLKHSKIDWSRNRIEQNITAEDIDAEQNRTE